MSKSSLPEVWLRGPLPEIPVLLQPIAHTLLQAKEEVAVMMTGFQDSLLWERPAGLASPGFHLQHLSGVADRLFTYARGEALNPDQLKFLNSEGEPPYPGCGFSELTAGFNRQVNTCIEQLKSTDETSLAQFRGVGRVRLPSTVLGLLTHAAEHTSRHVGQLLVTVKILMSGSLK